MTIELDDKDMPEINSALRKIIDAENMLDVRTYKPTYKEIMALLSLSLALNDNMEANK